MTGEETLRKAVRLLVEKYGELTTSEIKERMPEVLEYDSDDIQPSGSRNEIKILQRIGNIVSHQTENVKEYLNSYIVDKSETPARFVALTGIGSALRQVSKTEISARKDRQRSFKPKKVDWDAVQEKRGNLGQAGENFVVEFEKNRISEFAPEDTERVLHLSLLQGDGAGYDVLSINQDGTPRYIEVKTTRSKLGTPFFMSDNEYQFMKLNKEAADVFIYRIYNFNELNGSGNVKIITPLELFSDYIFDPTTYRVSLKKKG